MTRFELITELRTWEKTPWRHQGRMKGLGVDCIGLALAAADLAGMIRGRSEIELGIPPNYGRIPHMGNFKAFLDANLLLIPVADAKIADLVLLAYRSQYTHVAVLTPWRHTGEGPPFGLLHSDMVTERVQELCWQPRTWGSARIYRFPALT